MSFVHFTRGIKSFNKRVCHIKEKIRNISPQAIGANVITNDICNCNMLQSYQCFYFILRSNNIIVRKTRKSSIDWWCNS